MEINVVASTKLGHISSKEEVLELAGKMSNICYTEITAEDIFKFKSMEEAKETCKFLQLVTKYFVEGKEYKLLIDSEDLKSLLKKQELIEEPDT